MTCAVFPGHGDSRDTQYTQALSLKPASVLTGHTLRHLVGEKAVPAGDRRGPLHCVAFAAVEVHHGLVADAD